jgi:hypothetical protein
VVLPDEPPALTPAAARVLLRVLVKARARQEGNREMTDHQISRTGTGRDE